MSDLHPTEHGRAAMAAHPDPGAGLQPGGPRNRDHCAAHATNTYRRRTGLHSNAGQPIGQTFAGRYLDERPHFLGRHERDIHA